MNTSLNQLIKNRRSIFPAAYTGEQIPDELILEVLENANWAPNHRKTEPWRFKILQGKGIKGLADFMSQYYRKNTSEADFSQKKYEKLQKKPLLSPTILAICMQRDLENTVPEWEELAAVAMAVQNMWLTCTAHNIGCYWSTPAAALHADEYLGLKEGEKCIGLFYMGYHKMPFVEGKRGAVKEKIEWIR